MANTSWFGFASRVRLAMLSLLLVSLTWFGLVSWSSETWGAGRIDPMEIPKLTEYVTDYSSVLNPSELTELRSIAREYESKTSNQMVVVLFPNREWNELFDIAMRLFSRTGIGQKGTNNGILLAIATDEKKIRIVTGYGLEGDIPDVLASDFIETTIRPNVNSGNYTQAIRGFFERSMSAIGSDEAARLVEKNKSDALFAFSSLAIPIGIIFALNIVSLGIAAFLFWVTALSLGSITPLFLFIAWAGITIIAGFKYFNPGFATMFWAIPESSWWGGSGWSWGSWSWSGGGGFSWGGGSSWGGGAGD